MNRVRFTILCRSVTNSIVHRVKTAFAVFCSWFCRYALEWRDVLKKLLFALYDTQGYMRALTEYFGKKNFLLESHLFTKLESLVNFLKGHSLDVLLLGSEVELEQLPYLENVGHVIIMSEGNMVSECGNYPVIFKYQSAERILKEIFQIIAQSGEDISISLGNFQEHTNFYGIYRPYGEPFPIKRFFLEGEGQEEKSLFINLELLSGLHAPQKVKGEKGIRGMSEVIFYLKQRTEKLSLKVRMLIQQWEGVDYLYPVEDYRDLYSINREDVDRLLSVLAHETEYESVIFDVGFLNDSSLYLLYCCDRIYIPQPRNSWEENQKNALEQLLKREGLEEILDSICYVSGRE